jgi:hypothetical protein
MLGASADEVSLLVQLLINRASGALSSLLLNERVQALVHDLHAFVHRLHAPSAKVFPV